MLPAALARDQPGATAEAAACFEGLPAWDLELLALLEPQAEVMWVGWGGVLWRWYWIQAVQSACEGTA